MGGRIPIELPAALYPTSKGIISMTPTLDLTDEWKWDSVVRRIRPVDGGFFYAVKTTGVFCRPSCPSRLPNRKNVVFFATTDAAERAGFRACKRCEPNAASPPTPGIAAVVRVCRLIDEAVETPTLNDLAEAVGLSPSHLQKVFKKAVGVSPKAYATAIRDRRLKEELLRNGTMTRAIYASGFSSSGRGYETLSGTLGMSLSEYRGGAAGRVIRCSVVECALGFVAVAATERGVCLIELGDSPDVLRAELSTRFPRADLQEGDPDLDRWVSRVVNLIEVPVRDVDLPLDVRGTAFQRQVWEALRAIPPGEVATYAEIARRIEQPAAVRAVAGACAANQLAVVIPCHRVIRSGGGLGGYRWGVARKQQLLDREAKIAEPGEETS